MTIAHYPKTDMPISDISFMGKEFDPDAVKREVLKIKRMGVMVHPVMNKSTGEIIAGHITILALIQLGRKSVEVLPVTGSPEELKAMELQLSEGGPDSDSVYLETIRMYQQSDPNQRASGSQSRALEKYARENGLPIKTVRERYKRASRRLRHKRYMKTDRYKEIPIKYEGDIEFEHDYIVDLYKVIDFLKQAQNHLMIAKRATEAIITSSLPFNEYFAAEQLKKIDLAIASVVGSFPEKACTNCCCQSESMQSCVVCGGVGYFSRRQVD